MRILISTTLVVLVAACATTQQASSRPLLYPNATFNKMGQAAADAEVTACIGKAQAAGLSPTAETNAAAHGAATGGVMAGVAGVVGGLISGRSLESSIAQGAAGAVVGGATGAAGGAMRPNQANPLYRNFVQRCISEKGLESIGWN
jgi:hypothetical protein